MDKVLVDPVFVISTLKNKCQTGTAAFTQQEKQCWECCGSCNNGCVAHTDAPSGSQRWGPAVRREAPRGVRQRGPKRPDRRRSRGEPEQKACSLSGGSSTHAKIKMSFWLSYVHLHVLNCGEEATLDCPTYLRFRWRCLKLFSCSLVRFDELLQRYLLTSARWCWRKTGFSCCPTFPDSLSFPFTYFSFSHLCNLLFFLPLLSPSSISLQAFLPSQLFFASIPLFWLHPSNYSPSPLYPWKPNILSFFSFHRFHFYSLCF